MEEDRTDHPNTITTSQADRPPITIIEIAGATHTLPPFKLKKRNIAVG